MDEDFMVGDRVRVTTDAGSWGLRGKVGTVSTVAASQFWPIGVVFEAEGFSRYEVYAAQDLKREEPAIKVDDAVVAMDASTAALEDAYIPDLDNCAQQDHDYHMGYAAGYRYDRKAEHVKAGSSEQYRGGFLDGLSVYHMEQYDEACTRLNATQG